MKSRDPDNPQTTENNARPQLVQSSDTSGTPFRKPEQWKTGDEPITAAQKSYLTTLATEAGDPLENFDALTKAELKHFRTKPGEAGET